MADGTGLFSNLLGNASTYFDISRVFPGVEQFLDIEKSIKNINAQLGQTSKATYTLDKTTSKFLNNAGKAWNEYGTGIEIVTDKQEEFSESSKNLRDVLYTNAIVYGLSIDKMVEMSLEATKFNQRFGEEGVKSLTAFSDATGISAGTIGNFYAKMQATGALTEMSFEKMSASVLGTREKYGLATESLYDLFEVTQKYALVVGATEEKLINATTRMAEFISAMNSAGVETRTSADLLDKIIDPDRMQENYLLLSKMGLTMEDLNFGDPMENIQKSLPELKKIAEDIVSIPSRIAANEISKMYGYSLEQMREFSNIEFNEAEQARQKNTMEYRKEIQTALDGFENIKNSLFGTVAKVFNTFLSPVTKMLGPTGAAMFGVAMFGVMKKIGAMFRKISQNFADDIGKGVRYALTSSAKQQVLGGGSSGITEGLFESELRYQNVQKQAENYKKTAGVNNKNLAQIRQEISESVLGRDLTRIEKEIAAREEFRASKGKPAKKGKNFSIEDEVEFAKQKVLEIQKQREEIEILSREGSIPKNSAEKMLDSLEREETHNKNYINDIIRTNEGVKAYEAVFGQDYSRLEEVKKARYKSEIEIKKLDDNIAKLKTEGKYSDAKIAEELLGIETKNLASYDNEIKSLENTTSMFKKVSLEKSRRGYELNISKNKKIIAEQKLLLASGKLDDAQIKAAEESIRMAKAKIKSYEEKIADTKRAEALTVQNMEKTNVTTKALKKASKASAKAKKRSSANELLGLDADASLFQRNKKRLTTSLTSGFTGMVRGFSTGGIRGAASGALSGMSMAMPAILGISAAVGGILAISKKSDKFNEQTARITKSTGQFTEYIGTKIGDFIAPRLEKVANLTEKLVGWVVKDDETEDLANNLRDYNKAIIEQYRNDQGELLITMKDLNGEISYLRKETTRTANNTEASAMADMENKRNL